MAHVAVQPAEMEEQLALALVQVEKDDSHWPSMTYEEGVQRTLDWVLGNTEEPPMTSESDEEDE